MALLPDDFEDLVGQAVQVFWASRNSGSATQGGSRGNVIAGKNLDGFLAVVEAIARHCGIPEDGIYTKGRVKLTLPGYFRPTKNWDVLIIHRNRLLAVLEFKSQVGSFGNNFNNRSEEVLGNATDLKAALENGACHPANHRKHRGAAPVDPRPPFVGYLMLLEDSAGSTAPVKINSPHYKVFDEFNRASYADRYRILCEKLMAQGLYSAASLMLSPRDDGSAPGTWRSLSEPTNVRYLFTQFAANLHAAVEA